MAKTLAWHLAKRPEGLPTLDCFVLRDTNLPQLADGDVLVENLWLSVDPYMRGLMGAAEGYAEPYQLGHPMDGRAVGRIVESRAPGFDRGDLIAHGLGWRRSAVVPAETALRLRPGVPEQAYLGVLGAPGATAYFGLLSVAAMKPDDIVFVSAAAGAVGSTVVQLARAKGASRIIGAAGGADKAAWLKDLGCDAVIDHRASPDLSAALAGAAPDGIDVYFDNVGGRHLSAALANARVHARFAECGMIGGYNDAGSAPDLRDAMRIVVNRVRIEGFATSDFRSRMGEFYREMRPLVADGQVRARDTVFQGLETAPLAFVGLFSGANTGKMVVRL